MRSYHPAVEMLIASAAFSVVGALVKGAERLPTVEIVFFRSFINLALLLPWVLRHPQPGWTSEWKALLTRGISGCTAMFLYFFAIEHIRLADAAMLNYSAPIPVLVLSAIILGERLSRRSIAFVVLAFVGLGLILKPAFHFGTELEKLAGLAGFVSSLAAAIAYVSIKLATRRLSSRFIVFTFTAVASLLTFIPMLVTYVPPTPIEWLLLLGCGSLAALAQGAMTKAYAGLPASVASPLSLITVVFSAGLGWAVWGEVPDLIAILGGLLVVVGLYGAYRFRAAPSGI